MKILHSPDYPENGIVTAVFKQVRYAGRRGIFAHEAAARRLFDVDRVVDQLEVLHLSVAPIPAQGLAPMSG